MLTSAASHRATLLRKGAEQEKAQLISRIVSSVVVQSDTLQIENSKGAPSAPNFRREGRPEKVEPTVF